MFTLLTNNKHLFNTLHLVNKPTHIVNVTSCLHHLIAYNIVYTSISSKRLVSVTTNHRTHVIMLWHSYPLTCVLFWLIVDSAESSRWFGRRQALAAPAAGTGDNTLGSQTNNQQNCILNVSQVKQVVEDHHDTVQLSSWRDWILIGQGGIMVAILALLVWHFFIKTCGFSAIVKAGEALKRRSAGKRRTQTPIDIEAPPRSIPLPAPPSVAQVQQLYGQFQGLNDQLLSIKNELSHRPSPHPTLDASAPPNFSSLSSANR
jgi:hypothetical protein